MNIHASEFVRRNPYTISFGIPILSAATVGAVLYAGARIFGSEDTQRWLDQTEASIKAHVRAHQWFYGIVFTVTVLTISAIVADYMGWINLSEIKAETARATLGPSHAQVTATGDRVQMSVAENGPLSVEIERGAVTSTLPADTHINATVDHGLISAEYDTQMRFGADGTSVSITTDSRANEIANSVAAPSIVEVGPSGSEALEVTAPPSQ